MLTHYSMLLSLVRKVSHIINSSRPDTERRMASHCAPGISRLMPPATEPPLKVENISAKEIDFIGSVNNTVASNYIVAGGQSAKSDGRFWHT